MKTFREFRKEVNEGIVPPIGASLDAASDHVANYVVGKIFGDSLTAKMAKIKAALASKKSKS